MIDQKRLENAIREMIIALGDDPTREGLVDTPKRAAGMYAELLEGMNYTNDEIATMFDVSLICFPCVNIFIIHIINLILMFRASNACLCHLLQTCVCLSNQ